MPTKQSNINIDNLLLDQDNFRIGHVIGQEQSIKKIIEEQGSKIVNLAQHICENGLAPTTLLSVVKSEKNKYLIIDGNRRATAIKLVITPALAAGTKLEQQFKELHDEYIDSIVKDIPCIEMDLQEANKWRRVDHYREQSGVNQQPWSAMAKARADEADGNSPPALLTLDYALAGKFLDENSREIAASNSFNFSTLERIINSIHAQKLLNIQIDEKNNIIANSDQEWFLKVLSNIITIIIEKKFEDEPFSVRNINSAEEIEEFVQKVIGGIGRKSKKVSSWIVDKKNILKSLKITITQTPPPPPYTPPPPQPHWKRKYLIPNNHQPPNFSQGKLISLYRELRLKLPTNGREIAVALDFRALLEISLQEYCKKNNIKSATKSAHDRANAALDYMLNKNKLRLDKVLILKKLLNDEPVSVAKELNSYVHDPQISPTKRSLHEAWDNLVMFIDEIWKDIAP